MNSRDLDRFMPNVQADETGCWLWDGPRIAGYGNAWVEDKPMLAHRASYEHFIGSIPDGLEIDHLCEVKLCVHPLHLEPVTHGENSRRALTLGLEVPCRRNHALSALRLRKSGGRACRSCDNERRRERKAERKKVRKSVEEEANV